MRKEDIFLLLLAAALIAAAVITLLFGGEKSRHGLGQMRHDRVFSFIPFQYRIPPS